MSLVGKILAILNILAAVAFFFLGLLDYAKRQTWADAALQRTLVMEGIPLDENEPDIDGRPRLLEIRQSLLDETFRSVGGNPSRTQREEVGKVKDRLVAWLENAAAPGTRAQKLARILIPLGPTSSEELQIKRKDLLQRLADAKNTKTDDLEAIFNQHFDDVLAPTMPKTSTDKRDLQERKRAIATLLCRLAEVLRETDGPPPANEEIVNSAAYNRVLKVVGLNACSHVLDDYALYLEQVVEDVRTDMAETRAAFADASRQKIELLQDWAVKLERQKEMYQIEKAKVDGERAVVEKRKTEVDEVLKELAAAQEATRGMLKKQAEKEAELFAARKAARDAYEENQKLERRIRALEQLASPASDR